MDSEDIVCAENYRPQIPDSEYVAECIGFKPGYHGKVPKLFLNFRLINEPYEDMELFMSFNMPFKGGIRLGSRYYKAWAKVNGKLPSQNAKMSPRLFLNKLYRVKTRTVKPKDGGEELPEDWHYSIIDSLDPMF